MSNEKGCDNCIQLRKLLRESQEEMHRRSNEWQIRNGEQECEILDLKEELKKWKPSMGSQK